MTTDKSGSVRQLEPNATREQHDDKLVEADALARGLADEPGVQARGHSDKYLAAGFHAADSSACAIDSTSSAGDTTGMPKCEAIKANGEDCTLKATMTRRLRSGREEHYCGRHAKDYGARYPINENRGLDVVSRVASTGNQSSSPEGPAGGVHHGSGFNDSICPTPAATGNDAPRMTCTCGPNEACSSCPPLNEEDS